jgi:hypothetical protein
MQKIGLIFGQSDFYALEHKSSMPIAVS